MARLFVVLNPVAGSSDAEMVVQTLEQRLAGQSEYEVYQTTGQECVRDVVNAALQRGFDTVVAVGGDGTVSAVAAGLVGTGRPLGIIPAGTGNTLARELGIPLTIEGALDLVAGAHTAVEVDAMHIAASTPTAPIGIDAVGVDAGYYFLNASTGVISAAMGGTEIESKRRFGRLAYLWTGLQELARQESHHFTVTIDGQVRHLRATEIVIANCGAAGVPALRWGPEVRIDDGKLDLCVARARRPRDLFLLFWRMIRKQPRVSAEFYCRQLGRQVSVGCPQPLPVQADGELIGHTPVRVEVVPHALQVIVPLPPAEGGLADKVPLLKNLLGEAEQATTKGGNQ